MKGEEREQEGRIPKMYTQVWRLGYMRIIKVFTVHVNNV